MQGHFGYFFFNEPTQLNNSLNTNMLLTYSLKPCANLKASFVCHFAIKKDFHSYLSAQLLVAFNGLM